MTDLQGTDLNYDIQPPLRKLLNLGLWQTAIYLLQKVRANSSSKGRVIKVFSRLSENALLCRTGTSDIHVFAQIFVDREYRCLDDVVDADLIIDCGANVGYASAYFLTRFPKCKVIAIEPDPENFLILKKNLESFGSRAVAICGGVWSKKTALVLPETPYRDGREWARTVREADEGEATALNGIDIGSILVESGSERISILKIDIEGSESVVFGENYASWLSKVDNMVIELHGPECAKIFHDAIKNERFSLSTCDELVVCKRK